VVKLLAHLCVSAGTQSEKQGIHHTCAKSPFGSIPSPSREE
jgi:hypothetical protein